MAVPKKRTGHSAQGHRRSNWKAIKPETTTCSNCGATVLTHTVCTACGYYKGKPVRIKDRLEEEAKVLENKKRTKKTAAKKVKVEEVKEQSPAQTTADENNVKIETAAEETTTVTEEKVTEEPAVAEDAAQTDENTEK